MNNENEIFLSKKEVAEFLQCSEKTIDRMRKEGLPSYYWAGKVKFIKSEVFEWIKNNKKA